MAEYVFPKFKAHCVKVNGCDLVFTPGTTAPMHVSDAVFDLVQNCSGMTVSQSREWLQERYREAPAGTAGDLAELVDLGYFNEPQPGFAECKANLPPLTSFGICITHKCNMGCRYCFARELRETDEPEDITLETACAAIDFLFDVIQPPWVNISLGITGEPQLRWDLIRDIIAYGRQKSDESDIGVRFHITTNGLHIKQEMLEYLRVSDDVGVTLSWDGPPEIHNTQRLCPDGTSTYENVSNSFELLRSTMKTRLSVTATVFAANPDIAGVFAHLFDRGVRDLTLKPTRSVGPATSVTEESLPAFKESYAQLAEMLLTNDSDQMERLFTLAKDDLLGRYILRIAQGDRVLYPCPGGRAGYDVDTNGDIYPCASLVGVTEFRMGNVRTGFDERMTQFFLEDTSLPRIEGCKDCWAKYYCGGTCTYVSALTCGRFDIPYGPNCELTKYLIELAGYIVARLKTERPGLLEYVWALRSPVPVGPHLEALSHRAPEGGLWTRSLQEWRVSDPIVLSSREQTGGHKQLLGSVARRAEVHIRWDSEFLYLMAEVSAPQFTPPTTLDGEWWFHDSIQFALDPESDGGEHIYPWKSPDGDYEFGVTLVNGKPNVYDCQVDPRHPCNNIDAMVTRERDIVSNQVNTTVYRVAVPWKQISGFTPSVGAECRFSVVVNDCDSGIRGWLQWTDGLATRKAPTRFGLLRLVE